jgi:acyl carrier protein
VDSLEIKDRIRGFITSAFKGTQLDDRDDIFAKGYVNSLFAMELVLLVERDFGIEVTDDDLDLKNFRSVDAMTRFVLSKNSQKND